MPTLQNLDSMNNWQDWIRHIACSIASVAAVGVIGFPLVALSSENPERSETPATSIVCPANLDDLVSLMLQYLPSYANRVNQRAYPLEFRTDAPIPGYVILAGRPEFQPIEIASQEYVPVTEDDTVQVFFTTLERQYTRGASFNQQSFHWLFLTQTDRGWRFVLMLSSLGNIPETEPPTPPQASSEGVIAEAIRLWLRDCEAGTLRPL